MIAAGVNASAHGMSHQATLRAFDWNNDEGEMATEGAGGARVSNHSYGYITGWYYNYFGDNLWTWFGDPSVSATIDYYFGFYSSQAEEWDQIAFNAPQYLIVKSAGNDRGEGPPGTMTHRHSDGGTFSDFHERDGGTTGYDCISHAGVSKNILTIGAVNDIPGGYTGPGSVIASSFHSWGPTDDGRIKPDIVGNGIGLFSSLETSNTAYGSLSGTSMSSPNVSGSIGLLLEHEKNLWGTNHWNASTIKGLLIHTADEAGSANGPDYVFGWGLMNTLKAVQLISDDYEVEGNMIQELTLTDGDTLTFPLVSSGEETLRATICWTDPPATPPAPSLNPSNLMLVNDLDLRIVRNTTTYFPWVLNPASPAAAATTGDNFRDNVEQVVIYTPSAGTYTVQISHKGSLVGGSQNFSLILSGITFYGTITGVVYKDINNNGVKDSEEEILPGRIIELRKNNVPLDSAASDENGIYEFSSVLPGTYTIRQLLPEGWNWTFPGDSGYTVVMTAGDTLSNLDFGSVPLGTISVGARWNLVSVPLRVVNYSTSALFPTAISEAYSFQGGYQQADTLKNAVGYWLKFANSQQINLFGDTIYTDSAEVVEGWNLIGSISTPLPVSQIVSVPPGIVTSQFYGYEGGYLTKSVIMPGKGYWVKVSASGKFILSSLANNINSSNRIRIVPIAELPPPSPDENLNMEHRTQRFSLDYSVEQNYPNPFNPVTTIRFKLVKEARVTLKVFNMLGQEVATVLEKNKLQQGIHEVEFDAEKLVSGVYFYRLTVESLDENVSSALFTKVMKMLIVK